MAWIDIAILSVLAVSTLLSFFSGFVKEAVSLAALIAAIWAAFTYSSAVAVYMPGFLHSLSFSVGGKDITLPHLDIAAAAALIVLGVLLAGSIISYIATKLIRMAALGGADRVLGVMFGLLRGVVIVVLL